MKLHLGRLALPLALLCTPPLLHADEPDARVARVSFTGGDVSYQRGDSDGWNALGVNTPLVSGDSLYTADDGRAEVHLDGGNVLRLDAGTQVDLLADTQDLAQLGLRSGNLSLRARLARENAALEIDTPSGAATVLAPGVYRVEVTARGARYSVVKGRLSVSLSGQRLDVEAGESLAIEGTDEPTYSFGRILPETPFDRWSYDRDVRAERSASARYVHRDVVGYEDLDDQGAWRDTPDYGRVWTPSGVPSGWAPYQAGRWMWQDPFGWTWVSAEPWGWAPYHYGRWVHVSGAWGWVPPPPVGYQGPAVVAEIRPTYAPALVAFVGGKNWSVGISLGGGPAIGWVPLAPAEHYYYPWQPAPRVTNNYTNITVINAVTVVQTTNFASGPCRPIHVAPRQLARAPFMGYTASGVVPTHESLCPTRPRDPHSSYVPRHDDDRPLVVRTQPPPRPVPFHDKIVEIQKTGRPFDGHDRGEHNGWNGHGDRNDQNDRIATVSALAPADHKELKPRPGTTSRPPQRIDESADATRHQESHRPSWAARPEPPERIATAQTVPQPVARSVHEWHPDERVAPPAKGHDEQRAATPYAPERPAMAAQPERAHGRQPEPIREVQAPPIEARAPRVETSAPAAENDHARPQHDAQRAPTAHIHPAEPIREVQAPPLGAPAPRPAAATPTQQPARQPVASSIHEWHPAATPVTTASHPTPQQEGSKQESPKAKDDKAKGKDKHASEGQQQAR